MRLSQHIAISIVSVAVFFIVWQVAATRQWVDPLLLPSLTDIGLTTEELLADGYRQVPLWEHIAVSLARAPSAFAVAIIIGIPLGLLMGLSDGLAAVLNPFVQFLRPLPKIALIPLAVVWLGIGEASKFFLIFIATFLSVVVGASAADSWQAKRATTVPHVYRRIDDALQKRLHGRQVDALGQCRSRQHDEGHRAERDKGRFGRHERSPLSRWNTAVTRATWPWVSRKGGMPPWRVTAWGPAL